jgi:imidazolonepropionase-like amidohydrolase
MEHLYGVFNACCAKEDELRKEAVESLPRQDSLASFALLVRLQVKALDAYDARKADALFARFARNGTWQCPTLTVLRALAYFDDEKFRADPRLDYMPEYFRTSWGAKGPSAKLRLGMARDMRRVYQKSLSLVGAMHRAKVPLLAGTDTTNPYCFPGLSLHDELALLVEAGLSPLEALCCATLSPAKYLGRLDDLGTVAKGKLADLVLLEANPLDDVKNTRKIAAVVAAGKLLDRAALDKMLADVKAENKGRGEPTPKRDAAKSGAPH